MRIRYLECVLVASGVLFAFPRAGAAGTVSGEVHLPAVREARIEANPYPGRVRATSSNAGATGASAALADAVVYIETSNTPAPSSPPPAAAPSMAQKGQQFVPRVLPVLVHQTVDFPNQDPVYHNVFSYSPCCRFDLGRYARGKSKQVTFDQTGIVRVFCEIHSDMAGYILVLQNPLFTRPGADGRYRLDDVPPGEYTLVFWNPEIGRRAWPVTVPADGTVQFDLGL